MGEEMVQVMSHGTVGFEINGRIIWLTLGDPNYRSVSDPRARRRLRRLHARVMRIQVERYWAEMRAREVDDG